MQHLAGHSMHAAATAAVNCNTQVPPNKTHTAVCMHILEQDCGVVMWLLLYSSAVAHDHQAKLLRQVGLSYIGHGTESTSFTCCQLHMSHSGSQLVAQLLRKHLQGLFSAALTINSGTFGCGGWQLAWSYLLLCAVTLCITVDHCDDCQHSLSITACVQYVHNCDERAGALTSSAEKLYKVALCLEHSDTDSCRRNFLAPRHLKCSCVK